MLDAVREDEQSSVECSVQELDPLHGGMGEQSATKTDYPPVDMGSTLKHFIDDLTRNPDRFRHSKILCEDHDNDRCVTIV
jgi:hypothetical protein